MLPVLALDRFDERGTGERRAFLDELRETCHGVGFFYVSGHGVDLALCDRVLELSRAFFDLSEAERAAIDHGASPQFRGYTRLADERTNGIRDQREQIDLGADRAALDLGDEDPAYLRLQGPNLWPESLPELQEAVEPWLDQMGALGHRLLRAIAASLGWDERHFEPAFAELPHVHAKIIRYPGVDAPEAGQGVGAHKDYGFLSLLMLEPDSAGLQAEGSDGEWIDAPPMEGTFLVNLGEMLEKATGGELKATVHRVVSPPAGHDRISVPYFFNPRLDAVVGDETYGAHALRGWVRAHPEVANRHYPVTVTG